MTKEQGMCPQRASARDDLIALISGLFTIAVSLWMILNH